MGVVLAGQNWPATITCEVFLLNYFHLIIFHLHLQIAIGSEKDR